MGFRRYMVLAALLSCGIGTTEVLASTSNISTDPTYAESFIFYCPPYKLPFIEDRHYAPTNASCIYSVPSDIRSYGGRVYIMLYRGTPGNATLLRNEFVLDNPTPPTLVQLFTPSGFEAFGEVEQDMDFFGVVLPSGPSIDFTYPELTQFNEYFKYGTSTPPHTNYHIFSWKWGAKPVEEYDPVIIIPGILGSWEKDGAWILDPILHTYDNLVNTLLANGYVKDKTLFTFPYDWRNSNIATADLLKQKVAEIKTVCNCQYVDIIGHSMGGLVAAQYVASAGYANDIDQAIFVATPFLGAPKAYKTWEAGEVDFGDEVANILMRRIFSREARDNGYDSIFSYIQGKPISSIKELLPVYSYLYDADLAEKPYPAGYPQNTFLENLQRLYGPLFGGRSTIRTLAIASEGGYTTTNFFKVQPSSSPPLWEHGEPIEELLGLGDGTVPAASLEGLGTDYFFMPNTDHTSIASSSASKIFEVLNSGTVSTLVGNVYIPLLEADYSILINKTAPSSGDFRYYAETVTEFLLNQNPLIKNVLTIVLYSPVDMEIVAPDGKKLGKDRVTGVVRNEIPQARYSNNPGEHEYAIILDPLPGQYQVKTVGTESGAYTIAVGQGSSSTTTVATYTGATNTSEHLIHTLDLSLPTPTIELATSSPPAPVTPESCVADMQLAYKNKWITKKSIYNELVADCKLLKVLFATRDKAKNGKVRAGIITTIKLTLDRMDQLAKDKSNKPEAVQLIIKNTTWFRTHEAK
jgi:pimeloyl-ACP methyl ester carboxylesterase